MFQGEFPASPPKALIKDGLYLEQILIKLEKFGRPRLSKQLQGWVCILEAIIQGEGLSFEIRSSFEHSTPTDAAAECWTRLQESLGKMSTWGA